MFIKVRFRYLNSIFSSPFSGGGFISRSIGLVDVSNLRNKRIIRVGISQQRADRKQNLGNGQSRRPLVLQDVEADRAI